MHRFNDTASSEDVRVYEPKTHAVRSYEQIAQILAKRSGMRLTPARVAYTCRTAEQKIAQALLSDPIFREQLRPSAAQIQRAGFSR